MPDRIKIIAWATSILILIFLLAWAGIALSKNQPGPIRLGEDEQLRTFPSVSISLYPIQNTERWDAYHYVYLMTDRITSVPYASSTLFRGDIVAWVNDLVVLDVGNDRVKIRIPQAVQLFCYPTLRDGKPMQEERILFSADFRKAGLPTDRSRIQNLFPSGSNNMIVCADVTTTGEKTAYLVTHIGCGDTLEASKSASKKP